MSQLTVRQQFAADFFAAWSVAVDGVTGTYTSPIGESKTVSALVDIGTDQFGDDASSVSINSIHLAFLVEEVTPEQFATVLIDGQRYTLVQRLPQSLSGIATDDAVSVWSAQL